MILMAKMGKVNFTIMPTLLKYPACSVEHQETRNQKLYFHFSLAFLKTLLAIQ